MNEINNQFPEAENNHNPEDSDFPLTEPGTRLQEHPTPYLLHIQSGEEIYFPPDQTTLLLGKLNNTEPPDIDLSELPNSEIISRQHARIYTEAKKYYIEDLGSSNGTYVNNASVGKGERQEITSGDVIALGKEDKVTFMFKLP